MIPKLIKVILLLVLIIFAFSRIFYRSWNNKGSAKNLVDQQMSALMGDSVQVTINDLYSVSYALAAQKFYPIYARLLAEGKNTQAEDTLAKFKKVWKKERSTNPITSIVEVKEIKEQKKIPYRSNKLEISENLPPLRQPNK